MGDSSIKSIHHKRFLVKRFFRDEKIGQ